MLLSLGTASGKILVVDDSIVIRKILSRYLQSLECKFELCVDGSVAWEWFKENHQDCAGVITDLEMPMMGGDALIANVQQLCPGLPCFLVSGNDIPHELLPRGALRAIVKPITSSQVEGLLSDILRHHRLAALL